MDADRADRWVPTPKHVLRAGCLRSATAALPPGRFVELGAGAGSLTMEFLERGFHGVCYDIGADTRALLQRKLAPWGARVVVVDDIAALPAGTFDYVLAFEVLEHIEDDRAALVQWTRLLRPGGHCVVSVPAHQRKFGPDDVAVGHVRRYEKAQLEALFAGAGYRHVRVSNYGFPLGNLTRWVATQLRRRRSAPRGTQLDRSIRSGVERPAATRVLAKLFNRAVLAPFLWMQAWFYARDWGDGYVLVARKGGGEDARPEA